jgi:hypothetical protein
MKKWFKQKTTLTGLGMILGAAGGLLSGNLDTTQAIITAVTALQIIFLRQAVVNK